MAKRPAEIVSAARARVEHIFGDQRTRQRNILVRTKGKVRASVEIGPMKLTYNMRRLESLLRPQSACRTASVARNPGRAAGSGE